MCTYSFCLQHIKFVFILILIIVITNHIAFIWYLLVLHSVSCITFRAVNIAVLVLLPIVSAIPYYEYWCKYWRYFFTNFL